MNVFNKRSLFWVPEPRLFSDTPSIMSNSITQSIHICPRHSWLVLVTRFLSRRNSLNDCILPKKNGLVGKLCVSKMWGNALFFFFERDIVLNHVKELKVNPASPFSQICAVDSFLVRKHLCIYDIQRTVILIFQLKMHFNKLSIKTSFYSTTTRHHHFSWARGWNNIAFLQLHQTAHRSLSSLAMHYIDIACTFFYLCSISNTVTFSSFPVFTAETDACRETWRVVNYRKRKLLIWTDEEGGKTYWFNTFWKWCGSKGHIPFFLAWLYPQQPTRRYILLTKEWLAHNYQRSIGFMMYIRM